MHYSPIRHFTLLLAEVFSYDMHVLGAPPAFVLSQDQTLHRNSNNIEIMRALSFSAHAIQFSKTDFAYDVL